MAAVCPDELPVLRNPQCQRCDLHEGVKTVCVGTVRYNHEDGPWPHPSKDRALLVVGEAPGANEDKAGRPFVGKAGMVLRRCYIDFFQLPDKVDVYLGNAVRCRPPQNDTPTKTQLKQCQVYLMQDLMALQELYKEVIVLAVGGSATGSVLGLTVTAALKKQGAVTDFKTLLGTQSEKYGVTEWPEPCPTFVSYHPSYLNRDPSAGMSVNTHMKLLVSYLDGTLKREMSRELDIEMAPHPPSYAVRKFAYDIETYGFFQDCPSQTVYHPRKMETYDHVPKDRIIRIAGLSWRDPDGLLRHGVFNMQDAGHRRTLWSWFARAHKTEGFQFIVGQNVTFDLVCTRYCYPESRAFLNHRLPIWDTLVSNYLHDEGRPEKSLKSLAPLFSISEYEPDKPVKAYRDCLDPTGHQYVCQDTGSTLILEEKLESEIRSFYGRTQKLSPFCRQWYSDLLWLIVWMSETGISMNEGELHRLFDRNVYRQDRLIRLGQRWRMPLQGKGSDKSKRKAIRLAIRTLQRLKKRVPEIELTKTGQPQYKAEVRNALLDALRLAGVADRKAARKLDLIGRFQDTSKLLNSYLYPLLVGSGKKHDKFSTRLIDGTAYPSWFPVPSEFDDASSGGTKQARIVCKGPAAQTFPERVKQAITTRFDYLIWFDYSQIELVVAALLSGDPEMCHEYEGTPDLHGKTARLMFGDDIVNHPEYKAKYRQAGKTFNFRALYLGGAEKAQSTLMQDLGIFLSIERIHEIDREFDARHARLREWQRELARSVAANDYYELPLIGQSRLFLGGTKAKSKAINEIVNLPVQALAADIMLSSQYSLWRACKEAHLRTVVPLNVYDASCLEVPKSEIHAVRNLMNTVLPNPPFYAKLCHHLGRRLPLRFEAKEKLIAA